MDKELEKEFEKLKEEWNKFLIWYNNHSYDNHSSNKYIKNAPRVPIKVRGCDE